MVSRSSMVDEPRGMGSCSLPLPLQCLLHEDVLGAHLHALARGGVLHLYPRHHGRRRGFEAIRRHVHLGRPVDRRDLPL